LPATRTPARPATLIDAETKSELFDDDDLPDIRPGIRNRLRRRPALFARVGASNGPQLGNALGDTHRLCAPDICGLRHQPAAGAYLPTTLPGKSRRSATDLADRVRNRFTWSGNSYGGAIAFKIATDSPLANRVRSLTLSSPCGDVAARQTTADCRLHDHFADLGRGRLPGPLERGVHVSRRPIHGHFWSGSQSNKPLPAKVRLRMIEQIERLQFDFMAVLEEEKCVTAAERIHVQTLLVSGGLSPYLTQRIVYRLASIVAGRQHQASARRRPHAADLACRASQSRDCRALSVTRNAWQRHRLYRRTSYRSAATRPSDASRPGAASCLAFLARSHHDIVARQRILCRGADEANLSGLVPLRPCALRGRCRSRPCAGRRLLDLPAPWCAETTRVDAGDIRLLTPLDDLALYTFHTHHRARLLVCQTLPLAGHPAVSPSAHRAGKMDSPTCAVSTASTSTHSGAATA